MGAISGNGVSIEEALPLDGSQSMTGPLTIDQDDNAVALTIDSEATTANVFSISPALLTTGNAIDITDADALTTGKIINLKSNSADTSFRELVTIQNDNALATSTTVIRAIQDAAQRIMILDHKATAAGSSYIDFQGAIAGNVTGPISNLTTSGATTQHIQIELNGAKAWIAVSTNDPS